MRSFVPWPIRRDETASEFVGFIEFVEFFEFCRTNYVSLCSAD